MGKRKSSNIFLHFLNRDTQEIFGYRDNGDPYTCQLLLRAVKASVLLCDIDTFCIVPAGFWFESKNTRKVLNKCREFFDSGYIRISIRETDFKEYILKKREGYSTFLNTGRDEYSAFYDDNLLRKFLSQNAPSILRETKIGEYCSMLWDINHKKLIENGTGDLLFTYGRINEQKDRILLAQEMLNASVNKEKPFVWSNVNNIIQSLDLRDGVTEKKIRQFFEKNYYLVYLQEYNAVTLYNFYHMDKGIDFGFGFAENSIANYRWLEWFLGCFDLMLLNKSPKEIVEIKQSTFWADVFSAYVSCCNRVDKNMKFDFCCKKELDENREVVESIQKIKEILNMRSENKIYKNKHNYSKEKVDVLIVIATKEEEDSVLKNDKRWEKRTDRNGYDYFYMYDEIGFALVRSVSMGESSASVMAQKFSDSLSPSYLAMIGFCAGKRGKVCLGDVVVCETIYNYSGGKQISESDILPEIKAYTLNPIWKQKVERFGNEWRKNIVIKLPIGYEIQRQEFLKLLQDNQYSVNLSYLDDKTMFPDIRHLLEEMESNNEIEFLDSSVVATNDFKKAIPKELFMNESFLLKNRSEPQLRIGCLATGDRVQQWSGIFSELEKKYDRGTCAIDMEATGIADVAETNHIPCIIAKGVGDFATDTKKFDNIFIEYAVYSSYCFVVSFFKSLLSE